MNSLEVRTRFVKGVLTDNGVLPATTPLEISGQQRLGYLQRARVPVTDTTASGVFEEFRSSRDTESIQTLHRTAIGGRLLAKTTTLLFREAIINNKINHREEDPLAVFQSIVDRRTLKYATSGEFNASTFVTNVIGVHDIETGNPAQQTLQRIGKQYYGYDHAEEQAESLQNPLPTDRPLRLLWEEKFLSLDDIERIENWLVAKVGEKLGDRDRATINRTRKEWFEYILRLSLDEVEKDDVNDLPRLPETPRVHDYVFVPEPEVIIWPEETVGPEQLVHVMEQYVDAGMPDKALALLSQVPKDYKAVDRDYLYLFSLISSAYIPDNQQKAIEVLSGAQQFIDESDMDKDKKAKAYARLAGYHVVIADIGGLQEALQKVNLPGFDTLCYDLGVTAEQMAELVLLANFDGFTQFGTGFSFAGNIDYLLRGHYRDRIPDDMLEFNSPYSDLLVERIATLGERGIEYPTKRTYRKSPRIIKEVAILSGIRGNEGQFIEWLKRDYQLREMGGNTVRGEDDIYRIFNTVMSSDKR